MARVRRYLNPIKLEIYKKYKEDLGEEFKPNYKNRYQMTEELYNKLFRNLEKMPPAHKLRGISTLFDSKGEVVMEWVKTAEDREMKEELIASIIEGINSKIKKKRPSKANPYFTKGKRT